MEDVGLLLTRGHWPGGYWNSWASGVRKKCSGVIAPLDFGHSFNKCTYHLSF